jgi:phage-related minor tail protein
MANSRIAEVYVQMIPLMGKQFAKQAQKAINDAFNEINFSAVSKGMAEALEEGVNKKGLISDLTDAGTAGGKALKNAMDSAIGSGIPEVNTRGVVQQAGADGKAAGHDLLRAMNSAIGSTAPDINTGKIKSQAGADGKEAGKKLIDAFSSAISGASVPSLPAPAVPTGAATAAGAAAGAAAATGFAAGISGMSNTLKTAIVGAIAAAGIGTIVAKGMESAVKFDAGTREISASLGLTAEEGAKVSAITRSLFGQKYGESMEEVELATESVMTSFSALRTGSQADIEALTGTILNMAEAFEVDVTRASTVAGQMVTSGFAKDSEEAVNLLIATFQKVPLGTREAILDSMDEYSGFFQDVGITGEAGMTLLINASKRGALSLDKTSDAIKELFIRTKENASGSTDALKTLGLDAKTVQRDMLAEGETSTKMFEEIVSRLSRVKDAALKDQLSIALFGSPGEDLGKDLPQLVSQLAQLDSGLGDINETAATFNEKMRDQFAVAFGSITRTAELTFAEIFTPLLVEAKPMLEEFLTWLTDNKEEIKEFFIAMGEAIVTVVKPALEVIIPMLRWLFDTIIENKDAIAQWLPIILQVAGIVFLASTLWTVGTAIWGLAAAFGGAMAAASIFTFGGVAVSVGWVVALGAAVFGLGYWIGTYLVENFDEAMQGWGYAIDWILGVFNDFSNAVGDIFNNIVNFISESLGGEKIQKAFTDLVGPMTMNFVTGGSGGGSAPLYGMAEGGDVQYRPGGTSVRVSEEKPESVVNTGGLNRNIELQNEKLSAMSGGGPVRDINIYQQPGQSPQELTRIIMEELNWQEGRG